MLAADLLLQIQILRFEAGFFLFHRHTLRDVHEHRARMTAVWTGP